MGRIVTFRDCISFLQTRKMSPTFWKIACSSDTMPEKCYECIDNVAVQQKVLYEQKLAVQKSKEDQQTLLVILFSIGVVVFFVLEFTTLNQESVLHRKVKLDIYFGLMGLFILVLLIMYDISGLFWY